MYSRTLTWTWVSRKFPADLSKCQITFYENGRLVALQARFNREIVLASDCKRYGVQRVKTTCSTDEFHSGSFITGTEIFARISVIPIVTEAPTGISYRCANFENVDISTGCLEVKA